MVGSARREGLLQQVVEADDRRVGEQHVFEARQGTTQRAVHLGRLIHHVSQRRLEQPHQLWCEPIVERGRHHRRTRCLLEGTSQSRQGPCVPSREAQHDRPEKLDDSDLPLPHHSACLFGQGLKASFRNQAVEDAADLGRLLSSHGILLSCELANPQDQIPWLISSLSDRHSPAATFEISRLSERQWISPTERRQQTSPGGPQSGANGLSACFSGVRQGAAPRDGTVRATEKAPCRSRRRAQPRKLHPRTHGVLTAYRRWWHAAVHKGKRSSGSRPQTLRERGNEGFRHIRRRA